MARVAAEVRRGELVQAAIRVGLDEGLEAATVRRIAREAGVSLGTVHYCFGSKRALFEAVVESISQPSLELGDIERDDPLTVIRAAFESYWTEAGGNRDRQRLVYELVTHLVRQEDPGPDLARMMFRQAYETVEQFVDHYALRIDGLPVDRETVARMVVAMTDGVALAWIADGDDQAALRVLDAYALMFAATLGLGRRT
ncbi:TetR family transcriptional regulator [Calidifontibacter sp. DB0510]|uniref:TetR family transcriptional regulator n=1 Tax=Metallococcus carri TaxID=1656884 RepID=A0A967AZJ4_9MICO|nr:TetR/AcrR family transcriptional regulator [Metallococcus carri]NHN55254.1 TetR family transcriptional regulator [Metallococcus carri]NOP36331.1 TetR family transcriptional regulator [Calidifontibacter sp. DB2511S]